MLIKKKYCCKLRNYPTRTIQEKKAGYTIFYGICSLKILRNGMLPVGVHDRRPSVIPAQIKITIFASSPFLPSIDASVKLIWLCAVSQEFVLQCLLSITTKTIALSDRSHFE